MPDPIEEINPINAHDYNGDLIQGLAPPPAPDLHDFVVRAANITIEGVYVDANGRHFQRRPIREDNEVPDIMPADDHLIIGGNFNEKLNKFYIKTKRKQKPPRTVCVSCGKIWKSAPKSRTYQYGNGNLSKNGDYKILCHKCVRKFTFTECIRCSRYFEKNQIKFEHCPTCIEAAPRDVIKNYTFRVEDDLQMLHKTRSVNTDKDGKPKDEIYYGVELELESDNLGLDVLIVDSLTKKFACLKRDSSIKKGFEIVSAPATIEEHYHMWDDFFKKLPTTCKPLRSCGMHVHASRNRLSDLQLGKILVFLHAKENYEFVKLIAGRDSSFHNDFTKPKKFVDSRAEGVDRHTALNLNNDNTIEFRIFWATRDKRLFMKNIEFCKAMIKFADWATNSIKEATNFRKFVDWVYKNRKEYEYLALFFETPSIQKLLKDN